ncbi:histidine kinase [Pseudoalteromonas sp. MSK9-3]|uniref:sensor histidine kinase n=1 Tax=Pseudoalteromonas sp. MSK9-3 TaxID=1897633 RepID=UPI000ECE85C0|nr:sensor histidine kinase [Pseudoalteromonas sp. MSK9-3]RJE72325.1 histidine kinase [Pseudoalteromonas sp. MSK9-3]
MKLVNFLLLLLCSSVFAQEASLSLKSTQDVYSIKPSAFHYNDFSGAISTKQQFIDQPQLLSPFNEEQKKPHSQQYDRWLRVTLVNESQTTQWYLSFGFARLPKLAVYWQNTPDEAPIYQLTEHSVFDDRAVQDPQTYIPISIAAGEIKTLFVKYQTFANAPANIRIHSPAHYMKTSQTSLVTNAALAGVIAAILLIVVVNLWFNMNLTNVFYAIWTFLFFIIVVDMAGFTYQYIWPSHGAFAGLFSIGLMAVVPIFHLLFVRGFLQLKYHNVFLDKLYIGSTLLYCLLLPIALYLETVYYNLITSTLIIPLFAYTCWWSLKQSAPGIRIFALSLFNHILFLNVLTIMGASYGNAFDVFEIASYIKIGYLVEVCLFTIAMAIQHKSVQKQLVFQLQNQVNSLNQTVAFEKLTSEQQKHDIKKHEAQLFTDLSHELRTPLTVMKIQVESLQHNIVDNVHDSYVKLMDKIDELNQFINSLMLVTSTGDMHKLLKLQSVTLKPFINEVHQECQHLVDMRRQSLNLNSQITELQCIQFDPDALKKVILEVVKNALRFGGKDVEVQLSFLQDADGVIIRIEDSGTPLTYEAHQQLFQPLYRQEASRSAMLGGKGMGLAMCKKIIEAHRGKISSHNSLLGGLCIELKLPNSLATAA